MITSPQNPKIQHIKALLNRSRNRAESHSFIVEGVRLVEEAYQSKWDIELALYSQNVNTRGKQLIDNFSQHGIETLLVTDRVMNSLSETENSQGILAVMPMRSLPLPTPLDFVLITDAIRDPGNLGTLFRTAAAAGVQAIFLAPGTVDPTSPKVLRAGMGAHFRIPYYQFSWDEIREQISRPFPINMNVFLAEVREGIPCWEADLRLPTAIILGNEAEGAGKEARSLAINNLHIPMPGKSESLNAAAAGAILLFEVVRQRYEQKK